MKKLIILFTALVLFSSCDSIYYKGQFYKPLYSKSFIPKSDSLKKGTAPVGSIDTIKPRPLKDSLAASIHELPIDSLKARINRHEITYNNKYIYTRAEVGIKSKPPKNNKIIGYVVDDHNKGLKQVAMAMLVTYAILTALMSIIAGVVLFLLLFGIDNN